ncbi:uncharacterized protein NPIL_45331 [Nephila pilipes]|uniref:Uncharacterized protein n=1 Tax=Nephila pilipes TaxID=299642 RepID=A0A8X6NZN7_NEPPI|nr:uncharacterized protein NPIL_45331 [Nephila pilipes]
MRVKWNRQLDGSLTRKQAEELEEANKEKQKSTPKIFRLFRRKKHNRRVDEESDRTLETSTCTPSEADDEDCASISSVATVASQPVTEVCHRDRTMSLFSSFRLNFPGGKKKSKRGAPLFQEKEPENNRYSSPDLMREKLDAARSQDELSKSSPSVRNAKDSVTAGDFLSLGELRMENSISFQQLKHADAKGAQEDAKLAKSVSFSDCQASLDSKQVICTNAKTFRIANGHIEGTTKPCFPHSTCESKSTCADSLRLPTQPSFSNAETSKATSGSSSRVQSCDGTLRDRCQMNSAILQMDRNGSIFDRGPTLGSLDHKAAVMMSEKSTVTCNGAVFRNESVQVIRESNASHVVLPVTSEVLLGCHSLKPCSSEENFSSECTSNSFRLPSYSANCKNSVNHYIVDKPLNKGDNCETSSLRMKHSSFELPNNSPNLSAKDAYRIEMNENDSTLFTIEESPVLLNDSDSQHEIVPFGLSKGEPLCEESQKMCESVISKTDCVESNIFQCDIKVLGNSVENHPDSISTEMCLKDSKIIGFDEVTLPNFEKRIGENCLHDQELNLVKSEMCNDSLNTCQPFEVCVNNQSNILENLSSTLPSTNKLCFETDLESDQKLSCEFNMDSGEKGSNIASNCQHLQVCANNNEEAMENSCSSSAIPLLNKVFQPDDDLNVDPRDTLNKTSLSLPEDQISTSVAVENIDRIDVSPDAIMTDDPILTKSNSHFMDILKPNYNNISNYNPDILKFLNWMHEGSDSVYTLCSSCSRIRKSSILNLDCPLLYNLNNNSLFDVESYLLKLTGADEASLFSDSCGRPLRSVASYVRNLISHCELPLSSHGPSSAEYATVRGKPRSEERCPHASPSMSPSGPSSGVTLHEPDLHTGGSDTTQYAAVGIQDGSEMLSKVGASLALCGSPVQPYLDDGPLKEHYSEIYDRPSYPAELISGNLSVSSNARENEVPLFRELSPEPLDSECDGGSPEKCPDPLYVRCHSVLTSSDARCSEENHSVNGLRERMCNGVVESDVSTSEFEGFIPKADSLDHLKNSDETEVNGFVYEGVKEKIKLFESCSSDVSCDSTGSHSAHGSLLSLRRKSLERSKHSMIPSLKKAANEKKSDGKKVFKERIQPSAGDKSTKTKAETANRFRSAPSDPNDLLDSPRVNGGNLPSQSDYECLDGFRPEVMNGFNHPSAGEVNGELAERCKSEELLSPLRSAFKPQESRCQLQNRRHSATDANLCSKDDPVCEDGNTKDSLECSFAVSALDEVRGQSESRGLQSRCASLPLVIGQVRENCARRNYPITDASRGKSRIPRSKPAFYVSFLVSLHVNWFGKMEQMYLN